MEVDGWWCVEHFSCPDISVFCWLCCSIDDVEFKHILVCACLSSRYEISRLHSVHSLNLECHYYHHMRGGNVFSRVSVYVCFFRQLA